MRKNYIYLFFLFLFTTILFAQKVTITPTSVNGSNVSAGPINLASVPYSTISLGVKVEIPAGAAVGDQGTIKVYYMNSVALGANVANGGDGGTLYFGGGKTATKSFTINLNWADFQTSGGFVYAEYKNSNSASAVAYKSPYLSVVKNATMTTGTNLNPPADAPNPTKIPNTLCCDQIVRVGEKPAIITGSTYLNPYQGEPYGITYTWIGAGLSGGVNFLSNSSSTLEIDHLTEIGKLTVTRGLGYRYGGQYPNKSNAITITVVQTPILRNTISASGSINSEGFIELSSIKNLTIFGMGSVVNLKVLQDPFYTIQPRDPGVSVDSYKWEYTKTNTNQSGPKTWTTISNENSENLDFYDPSEKSNLEDTYYLVRRIAIYQNISNASEPIKVVVRGLRYNNTICCDQILKISSLTNYETPSTIIGSTPTVDNPNIDDKDFSILRIGYQWQSQIQERGLSVWTDIPGATSKDYLLAPSSLKVISGNGRRSPAFVFESSYNYRRIARINYQTFYPKWINTTVTSYSNEVSLTGSSNEAYMKIYPNPTSSILNIESTSDISDAKVTISNIIGNIVNSNNYSVVNPKLISINVTGLTVGTYFITIDSQSFGTTQKTFIKQ
ncbi:T9SS type A sorting domain-containing protein [Flavobacterium sp. ov086]|uniref:T9SS type A sorting domain-containing protein n=1 Tax=Flavobacterium sp. ov086 TaxID=1761785 RepID=UPI000B6C4C22|nr:T9SS type A sorting domain-containing protein [Flavobacterium sp. ov086]SNR59749.1 Por secretion system C-terminal sorting domain-containing protein [Flavobacterium sp. ov086]